MRKIFVNLPFAEILNCVKLKKKLVTKNFFSSKFAMFLSNDLDNIRTNADRDNSGGHM